MCFSVSSSSYEPGSFYWAARKARGIFFFNNLLLGQFTLCYFFSIWAKHLFLVWSFHLFVSLFSFSHVPLHQTLTISPFSKHLYNWFLDPCSIIQGKSVWFSANFTPDSALRTAQSRENITFDDCSNNR